MASESWKCDQGSARHFTRRLRACHPFVSRCLYGKRSQPARAMAKLAKLKVQQSLAGPLCDRENRTIRYKRCGLISPVDSEGPFDCGSHQSERWASNCPDWT